MNVHRNCLYGEEFLPLRRDEKENAVHGAVKSHSANEQSNEHYVRENGCEVSHFTRRLDAFDQRSTNQDPRE